MGHKGTDRENERDSTPHCLGPVQVSLGAEKEVLFATGRLPGNNGSAIKEDLDSFPSR